MADDYAILRRTAELATEYLRSLPERPVKSGMAAGELRRELITALPERGEAPEAVIEHLAEVGGPAIATAARPRTG
ncbi:MAG TPA: hypothetical protein VHH13_11155 [Arthrobacter sp.]|nr:hypothetical protein [Arthrobacter sp.]